MTRDLLWRGLAAGAIAAVCATIFARLFGEPHIDLAIAFEQAHAAHGGAGEPELVSRAVQKGLGLLTALGLYGAARRCVREGSGRAPGVPAVSYL